MDCQENIGLDLWRAEIFFFFLRKSGYIKAYMIIICTIIIVNKQMKICLVLNPQIYVI